MASIVFGRKGPAKPHLVASSGGLSGEVKDLRSDAEEAFLALERSTPHIINFGAIPIQGVDADGIKTSFASTAAPVTLTGTGFDGVLAPSNDAAVINTPKKVTLTVSGGGTPADWLGGTVTITGTDVDGDALSENVTSAAGAGTTTTTNYFATVSQVVLPAAGNTGALLSIGVAADTACIASGNSATSAQTLDADADFNRARVGNREMPVARQLALVLSSHANWDLTTATVYGYDARGYYISEDFSIPNNGNTTVNGTKAFKRVTKVYIPAQSGASGTWSLGIIDTTAGLDLAPLASGAGGIVHEAVIDNYADTSWSAPAAGALTLAASAGPYGIYTPNTAPNGVMQYLVCYIPA